MNDSLPHGVEHLYGALYSVPFELIETPNVDGDPDIDENAYQFSNPRMLTEYGSAELIDRKNSAELRSSIRALTLLNPLVCRWMQKGDELVPQLVGGDRRYRALDFLIRKKEVVRDPRSVSLDDYGNWIYKEVSADVAYAKVPCQIFAVNDDLDALALAWAENKTRINLTDGHEIAEVMNLRKFNASDERILEILQQDEKWLMESDRLISNLDEATLSDLIENRMTRSCAMELIAIADLELREQIRIKANEAALETSNRKIKRFQNQIEAALDEREIAEGTVANAEFHHDEDGLAEAQAAVAVATKKVEKKIQERDAETPVATVKNLKQAKAQVMGGEVSQTPKILKAIKIKEGLAYLDALIASDGECLEGTFVANVEELKLARRVINQILDNDADFASTIRRHIESKD